MSEPISYPVRRAAEILGVSRYVVYESIRNGGLPFVRLHPDGEMRILADDLHGWLARNRVELPEKASSR